MESMWVGKCTEDNSGEVSTYICETTENGSLYTKHKEVFTNLYLLKRREV